MPGGGRKDLDDLFQEFTDSTLVILGLVLVIGIGVWIVSWIRSRLADDEGSATEDHRLLSQIADLKEQGDLTEEEYRSIKGRLAKRIDDALSAPDEDKPAHQVSQAAKSRDQDAPETGEEANRARDETDG